MLVFRATVKHATGLSGEARFHAAMPLANHRLDTFLPRHLQVPAEMKGSGQSQHSGDS